MAKLVIEEATLIGLADSLREVTGKNRKFTPDEMIEEVKHVLDSLTYILVDENGTEVPAVFLENEVVFDATANDIRLGKVAVTGDGVTTGTKDIPAYQTEQGVHIVKPGKALNIPMYSDQCQYTKLQAIVCTYAANVDSSVSAVMVVIDDKLYTVGSSEPLAEVSVDAGAQTIKLGFANTGNSSLLIRYMTIKEEP